MKFISGTFSIPSSDQDVQPSPYLEATGYSGVTLPHSLLIYFLYKEIHLNIHSERTALFCGSQEQLEFQFLFW